MRVFGSVRFDLDLRSPCLAVGGGGAVNNVRVRSRYRSCKEGKKEGLKEVR